ncbi:nitrous oxide reductase family maturation protein NosD [Sulfurospirillum sp. 1612]|uniref:nitrous oxide reductase family maturation protein NosD n=1 Tax=Sulfurospirillum sp. 1612 TaxID=3094835 RepID=UPI002F943C33
MKKILFFITLFCTLSLFADQSINHIIAHAQAGSKITLPKGVFRGPIVIDKPLILEGSGKESIIQGDGNGTVIMIKSSYVTIQNLSITNSGHQRHRLDSGIKVDQAHHVTIENCHIYKTLFGIILFDTSHSKIINNTIKSYQDSVIDNRGDGIRLWNSHNNLIAKNHLIGSRDLSLNRSNHNKINHNTLEYGRFSILINMSHDVSINANNIYSNYAGVRCVGSKNIDITNNQIVKTHLTTGTGIMLEGGKNIHVTHNVLTGHSQAFFINASSAEIGMQRYIKYNKIINNNVAFHFYNAIKNNTIKYNNVIGNLEDVVKDIRGGQYYHNDIEMNYWDRYVGFDKDKDGISDIPYQVLIYADQLWQFEQHLKFFYATPLLSVIDLLERLAPFSQPVLLIEDTKPKTKPVRL